MAHVVLGTADEVDLLPLPAKEHRVVVMGAFDGHVGTSWQAWHRVDGPKDLPVMDPRLGDMGPDRQIDVMPWQWLKFYSAFGTSEEGMVEHGACQIYGRRVDGVKLVPGI
ncbi:MAG: hypothetical protein LBL95_08725, partial [Deltaproteobacteria bacterium]|nr:hypothetical protein [Deltaproteobacteria bacterium]